MRLVEVLIECQLVGMNFRETSIQKGYEIGMRTLLPHVSAEKLTELDQRLREISNLSVDYIILLCSSTLIASLGLFQNSPAVIIGAMIVAPLMRPLMGLSLAVITADTKLLYQSLTTLLVGTVFGFSISWIMGKCLGFIVITGEILSRTHPNLLDLGVAIVAGMVGAYCQTSKKLADSLAGVAISVALVPPLSVVGIGLALNEQPLWTGALLLYATNMIGITFAGALVFFSLGYTPLNQARKGLFISAMSVLLLIIPLAYSMHELILENQLSSRIQNILKRTQTFKGLYLQDVEVKLFRKPMSVVATVISSQTQISSKQVKLVQDFLEKETNRSISFKLRIIKAEEISAVELTIGDSTAFTPLQPVGPRMNLPILDHLPSSR